jgi:hypothetical protein
MKDILSNAHEMQGALDNAERFVKHVVSYALQVRGAWCSLQSVRC